MWYNLFDWSLFLIVFWYCNTVKYYFQIFWWIQVAKNIVEHKCIWCACTYNDNVIFCQVFNMNLLFLFFFFFHFKEVCHILNFVLLVTLTVKNNQDRIFEMLIFQSKTWKWCQKSAFLPSNGIHMSFRYQVQYHSSMRGTHHSDLK